MNRPYTYEELKSLSPDLLNELFEVLSSMKTVVEDPQSQQVAIWTNKDHCCPNCGSKGFMKNGHQKNGAQKFICKDCGRSFSMSTDTVGYGSHFNIEKWTKFIECELNGLSHRKTADIVGIHRNTALLWRHKLYNALDYLKERKLKGHIQIDAKNISINFKGQRSLPRLPKKRASKHQSSKNRHTSCIVSAVDDEDHIILKITGYGKETKEMYKCLSEQIEAGSSITCDGFMGFEELSKEWGCNINIIKSDKHIDNEGNSLSSINQIHSELEIFLSRYHGISTRHLQGYLNMFVLRKELNYHFHYSFQNREAWKSSIPYHTEIKRRNESSIPYPFDIRDAYSDYLCKEMPIQLNDVA